MLEDFLNAYLGIAHLIIFLLSNSKVTIELQSTF